MSAMALQPPLQNAPRLPPTVTLQQQHTSLMHCRTHPACPRLSPCNNNTHHSYTAERTPLAPDCHPATTTHITHALQNAPRLPPTVTLQQQHTSLIHCRTHPACPPTVNLQQQHTSLMHCRTHPACPRLSPCNNNTHHSCTAERTPLAPDCHPATTTHITHALQNAPRLPPDCQPATTTHITHALQNAPRLPPTVTLQQQHTSLIHCRHTTLAPDCHPATTHMNILVSFNSQGYKHKCYHYYYS